jgi:hypothetical protein
MARFREIRDIAQCAFEKTGRFPIRTASGRAHMAIYYQTEYRLGRRGRRVSRSYTGFQACVAILLDLIFGLAFGLVSMLVGFAIRLIALAFQFGMAVTRKSWKLAVAVMTVVVYLLTLPFALVHQAVDRVLLRGNESQPDPSARPIRKPEWALSREV